MKKSTKKPKAAGTQRKSKVKAFEAPKRRESPTLMWLGEACTLVPILEKSYVLSRFWAWFSRIEMTPHLRIPVPRFLSVRDP